MVWYHIQRKTILPKPHDWVCTHKYTDLDTALNDAIDWLKNMRKLYPEVESPEPSIRVQEIVDGVGTNIHWFI